MKTYKDYDTIYLGWSDYAALTVTGYDNDYPGIKSSIIKFGGDDSYTAYLVPWECPIPKHYHFVDNFDTWARIYDDQKCRVVIHSKDRIAFYRAGNYGLIIKYEPIPND